MDDDRLIAGSLDDTLTPEEDAELARRLESDGDFRERLLGLARTEGLLHAHHAPAVADAAMAARLRQALTAPERPMVDGVRARIHRLRRRRTVARRLALWLPLAAAALVLLLVAPWHALVDTSTTPPVITAVSGTVTMQDDSGTVAVAAGMSWRLGRRLCTAPGAMARCRFADGTELELGGDARLVLATLADGKRLRLDSGALTARVARQPEGRPLVLATPHGAATVLGTVFTLAARPDQSRLEVNEGAVRMATALGVANVTVLAGQYAVTDGTPTSLVLRPLPATLAAAVGPIPDRVVDERAATWFVSPTGNDANDGRSRATAFATMQKAADAVQPGQMVLVGAGTYPVGFHIAKVGRADAWISFVAEAGVEIRGSDVRTDWRREPGDDPVWSIPRPELFPGSWQKPGVDLKIRPEQVFANGVLLRQVDEQAMLKPRGVFHVDDEGRRLRVCLEGGRDPNAEAVAVTMRSWAINVGMPPNRNSWDDPALGERHRAAFIRIDGFRVRHIGNFSRNAAIQVRGLCSDIIIENCDVQEANYFGIAVNGVDQKGGAKGPSFKQRPQRITVRHCIASRNGVQGINGGEFDDSVFAHNLIDRNNYKGISPWNEGGAIKLLECSRCVMRGNVARLNDNHGLWFDYADEGNVIENNLVYDSIAGGILNEVTPRPGGPEPDAAQARARIMTGTAIRNNIVIGTRTPGGGGINNSNSCDTMITNNILVRNAGGGINLGGSPTRKGSRGSHRNEAARNLCWGNSLHATAVRDADDVSRRFFANRFHDNLFLAASGAPPFQVSGAGVDAAAFDADNRGPAGIVDNQDPFRDAAHWDFTLKDPALAQRIGFDDQALRLDWSAFWLPPVTKGRKHDVRVSTPIDLTPVCNRALKDEVAGDGRGGWTDQGANDMGLLPTGRQTFDGMLFHIGSPERGAVLLANGQVKNEAGAFPDQVAVPAAGTFAELHFLYASAWTGKGEVARFTVTYADGITVAIPITAGKQVVDWWTDPTWQQHAALNDHDAWAVWQGPNRAVAKVTLCGLRWTNPHPGKALKAIAVDNRRATAQAAFFWLAVSGANPPAVAATVKLEAGEILRVGFDGDVDGISASGPLVATGFNAAAFDAGRFTDGVAGKAFATARHPAPAGSKAGFVGTGYSLPAPTGFLAGSSGTLALWLQTDEWATRVKDLKPTDYRRTMTPFSSKDCTVSVMAAADGTLPLRVSVSGGNWSGDVAKRFTPGRWVHVAVVWRPAAQAGQTELRVFLDDTEAGRTTFTLRPASADRLRIGMPSNGGQPWFGLMDELRIWDKALDDAALAALTKRP